MEDGEIGSPQDNSTDVNEGIMINPSEPNQPSIPTVEEYIKHQITHYPTKPWCPICVKNSAQNKPHKITDHQRESETISMDYMYMTSKPADQEKAHPILVLKSKIAGGVWSLPVTRKGPYLTNIVERVTNIINSIGAPKLIIKSDQEPAMKSMQVEVRKEL